MMSTLELLPMWGGAEPDVELFFSGNVVADDGEWAGGQSLGETETADAGKSIITSAFDQQCVIHSVLVPLGVSQQLLKLMLVLAVPAWSRRLSCG